MPRNQSSASTSAPSQSRGSRGQTTPRQPQPAPTHNEPEVDEDTVIVEGETRRERFERLATARMRRTLKDLRLLGNLASDNYDYSEEDAALIEDTLRETLTETLARFRPKMRGSRGELHFTFHREAETE